MAAFLRKYATATHIYVPIVKRGVVDFAVGADWTPATGDVKVSIDGGAAANIGTLPTAVTMGNTAYWDFTIATGEVTGKLVIVTVADSATKAVEDQSFCIETYGNASAQYQWDMSLANLPANVTQLLGTAWLTPAVAGTPDVNAKQLNGQTAALNANNFLKVSLNDILATTLTETSGQLAGGFKKFFNIATPAATMDHLILVDTATTATNLTTNNDKAGYSLTQAFPTNFADMAITASTGIVKADLTTIKTQTVTCAGGVTIPAATLASTTNITAGTITTVTNLTNAPTSGDLTATMKSSISGLTIAEVTLVDTVTTVSNQLTAAQIATGIWQDTTASDFTTALSVGKSIMNGVTLGTGLTVARCTLTDTLTTYTGNTPQTGDSFARIGATGSGLTSLAPSATALSTAQWTNTLATNLGTLAGHDPGATLGTSTLDAAGVRTAVGLATANLDTQLAEIEGETDDIAAIKAKTDNLPASPAAVGSAMTLTTGERNSVADALLDRADAVETGVTPRQYMRGTGAILCGLLPSGAGSGTEAFKGIGGSATTRLTFTVDVSGNRTAGVWNL